MRFFSNDKDAQDDQGVDVRDRAEEENPDQAHDDRDLPDHVQSDPVAVPQQRTSSPWSTAPDGTVEADRRDDTVDGEGERPPFHEPGPQPTAFGASTVGGAVAASATANPEHDRWDVTDRETDAASGVADDRSVAPGDGVVSDDRDRDTPPGATAVSPDEAGTHRADDTRSDSVDVALDDRGTFEDPQVRDADGDTLREDTTPPDHAVADTSPDATPDDSPVTDADRTDTDAALKDEGGFDDPKAVDPASGQTIDGSDRSDAEPAFAAVPVAAAAGAGAGAAGAAGAASDGTTSDGAQKPGSVATPDVDHLFGDDAQSFRERWRDVQLRFVDSPKEATAEAAGLVDEVVDRLAGSLRSRKAAFAGEGSDDTEKLRVELRGYRDLLNRILDL